MVDSNRQIPSRDTTSDRVENIWVVSFHRVKTDNDTRVQMQNARSECLLKPSNPICQS